jgi:iron(III) transport system substrate-binding protein
LKPTKARLVLGSIVTLSLAATIVAGCSTPEAQAASSPGTLVLYSAQGYDQAMATAFQKATGIHVLLTDDSTGPLIAKTQAEASNPHWDVVWFDGDSSAQAMDNQGLLLRGWTPTDVKNYTSLGVSLIARDKSFYPTGVTAMGAIGYNPKVTPVSQLPKTLNDLLSPKWKNAVAMNDPAVSGPTYPLLAGVYQQMGSSVAGENFFTKLKGNGLHVYSTNDVTISSVLTGKAKLAFVQDSALINDKMSGQPIGIDYLKSGSFTLPSVIAIDKNAPHMKEAKAFIQWVLSKQGQSVQINPKNGGGDSYYEPVIQEVQPDAPASRHGVKWVKVNPVTAANEKNAVEAWFHGHIKF